MSSRPISPPTPRARDAGFTVIEALVATGLTVVVITAAMSVFTQGLRLTETSRLASELNQGLQVGVSLMTRDLMQAGTGIPTGGIPIPNGAGAQPVQRPGPAGLAIPTTDGTLPTILTGASLGPSVLGVQTDIVSVLFADQTLALNEFPLVNIAGTGDNFTVDPATNIGGANGLKVGDLILFTNPLGSALRIVTQAPAAQVVGMTAGDPLNFNQMAAAEGTLQALQSGPGTFPPTTATRVLFVTYYVDTVTDPAMPRLVRQVNGGQQLAVARGIENLQFTFDLVDGALNPANVDQPPVANSPHQIRKVNIFVSGRSLDLMPQLHQPFRNSMATQVALRNLSFVDRYQ